MRKIHMHTREISVGGTTISIETGRLAKQADGAVVVRSGDTMVLVTACADANPREGVDFLPLTVRLQGERLCVGTDPRRVLQARRQAARKGSAHEPPDRSPDPAAVPGRLAQRDADHRARDLGRLRERLRRARDHRRLGRARAVEHPADADDRRACASATSTATS